MVELHPAGWFHHIGPLGRPLLSASLTGEMPGRFNHLSKCTCCVRRNWIIAGLEASPSPSISDPQSLESNCSARIFSLTVMSSSRSCKAAHQLCLLITWEGKNPPVSGASCKQLPGPLGEALTGPNSSPLLPPPCFLCGDGLGLERQSLEASKPWDAKPPFAARISSRKIKATRGRVVFEVFRQSQHGCAGSKRVDQSHLGSAASFKTGRAIGLTFLEPADVA